MNGGYVCSHPDLRMLVASWENRFIGETLAKLRQSSSLAAIREYWRAFANKNPKKLWQQNGGNRMNPRKRGDRTADYTLIGH
jgi:hypothetical protein